MSLENYQQVIDDMMPPEPVFEKTPVECWTFKCSNHDCPLVYCENEIELEFTYEECKTCGEHFE